MNSVDPSQRSLSPERIWWNACHDVAVALERFITRDPKEVPAEEHPDIIADLEAMGAALDQIEFPDSVAAGHAHLKDAALHLKLSYEHLVYGQSGEMEYYYAHALMMLAQLYQLLIDYELTT